jgi:hypothetical protein
MQQARLLLTAGVAGLMPACLPVFFRTSQF